MISSTGVVKSGQRATSAGSVDEVDFQRMAAVVVSACCSVGVQDAFMVAATGNESAIEDFYFSRMVFSEGAHVKCLRWKVQLAPLAASHC